jgi:hypothetical protein
LFVGFVKKKKKKSSLPRTRSVVDKKKWGRNDEALRHQDNQPPLVLDK